MAVQYLIDGAGRVWDPYDSDLLAELGEVDPDFDLIDYCVRNLGMVYIVTENELTRVRFRWVGVSSVALRAADDILLTLPQSAIRIACEEAQWTERQFADAPTALAWLVNEQQSAFQYSDVATSSRDLNYLSNRRLSSLSENDDKLALLFKKWRIAGRKFSPDVALFLTQFGLLDRAVLARQTEAKSIVWEHIGTHLNMYGTADWQHMLVGRPVTDQPDRNYGKYTATVFRSALEADEPRFDHVDAVIRERSGVAHRSRYDRLVLPWRSQFNEKIVTTLSYKTQPDALIAARAP